MDLKVLDSVVWFAVGGLAFTYRDAFIFAAPVE